MSDSYNGGDTVGRGDMEESVDTGGVNPGQVAGNQFANTGDNLVGDRGVGLSDEEVEEQTDDALDRLEGERERYDSIEDLQRSQIERREAADAAEAAEEALMEELAAQEAEKDAAREEAHANGEAFYEGDTRHDGEDVQEWSLPDGTIILVNEDGDAVSVEWPPGEGPVYIGDVIVGGEPHSVWEMPSGTQIVVDADGNTVGTLDEVDIDDIAVDKYLLTNDTDDIGTQVVVEYVPGDDYSTEVKDAETGEVYATYEAGDDVSSLDVFVATDGEVELHEDYSLYLPPGSDHYIIVDENGQPVGTVEVPEEPEWSVFGVVEYYGDGEVVVNIGDTTVSVDVVGPDGGISVELDMLIGEATAGIEWSEDGSWEFETSVDVDTGVFELEAEAALGQDAAGMWHVDVETYMEMSTGGLNLEGGQHFHFQETPDGFEMNLGWEGKVSSFGFYVERAQDVTLVLDGEGVTATYQDMVGAGHEWMGGVQLTYEGQVRVDEDGDVEGTTGIHGRIVDNDGDEVVGGGTYLDSELGGPTRRNEQLDTGRDYERQYDDGAPDAPDADGTGGAEVDRFGLAGQEGEEATSRLERAGMDDRPEGIHDTHMHQGVQRSQEGEEDAVPGRVERLEPDDRPEGIHGMETGFGGRAARTGAEGGEPPEMPSAVVEALAGRFADVGSNANHVLGQTEGSNWRMRAEDDSLMRPSFGDGAVEPAGFYEKGNKAAGVREGDEPEGVTLPNIGKIDDQPDGEFIGETEKNLVDDADSVFVPGRTDGVSDEEPEGADPAALVVDGPPVDANQRLDGAIKIVDDVDLDDITGAPPARQTADVMADRSQGGIERPDGDELFTMDEGTEELFTMDDGPEELSGDADWEAVARADMRPSTATDQAETADPPHVVEEAIPMQDADRGQLPDDDADGKRPDRELELADDIAPAASGFQALPELDADVATDQAPEAESVAQVETAIPAFRPELEDEVVVAVEIDVTASVVDLAGDESDDLFTMDAGTTDVDDQADDQLGDG